MATREAVLSQTFVQLADMLVDDFRLRSVEVHGLTRPATGAEPA